MLNGNCIAAVTNEDKIYKEGIMTALLYKTIGQNFKQDAVNFPIIQLGDQEGYLRLEFDELGQNYFNYYAKIIPCNADWTTNNLQDLEFLETFNEFPITEYEVSINTPRKPYYHYSFRVPNTKISGNFILKIYKDHNEQDVILTRRFNVYEDVCFFSPDIKFPVDVSRRFDSQQIDFLLSYGRIADQMYNPADMLKVVIRQNGIWQTAIYNLKPQFVRTENQQLDFHFFNTENLFFGGNEYRSLDIRSMRMKGQGVDNFVFDNNKADIFGSLDQSRNQKNYNQWIDANGQYVIENFETRGGAVESDYVYMNFNLFAPGPVYGTPYVYGKLTNWEIKPEFAMVYDKANSRYTCRALLKQGFYNYKYVLVRPDNGFDEHFFEGTYNLTENNYDFFAYFRPVGSRYDRMVGYQKVSWFGRP